MGALKASVIHVMGSALGSCGRSTSRGPTSTTPFVRVHTGQGAETEAGFSFQTNVDQWYRSRSRDIQSGAMLERVRPATAVLFLPGGERRADRRQPFCARGFGLPHRERRAAAR